MERTGRIWSASGPLVVLLFAATLVQCQVQRTQDSGWYDQRQTGQPSGSGVYQPRPQQQYTDDQGRSDLNQQPQVDPALDQQGRPRGQGSSLDRDREQDRVGTGYARPRPRPGHSGPYRAPGRDEVNPNPSSGRTYDETEHETSDSDLGQRPQRPDWLERQPGSRRPATVDGYAVDGHGGNPSGQGSTSGRHQTHGATTAWNRPPSGGNRTPNLTPEGRDTLGSTYVQPGNLPSGSDQSQRPQSSDWPELPRPQGGRGSGRPNSGQPSTVYRSPENTPGSGLGASRNQQQGPRRPASPDGYGGYEGNQGQGSATAWNRQPASEFAGSNRTPARVPEGIDTPGSTYGGPDQSHRAQSPDSRPEHESTQQEGGSGGSRPSCVQGGPVCSRYPNSEPGGRRQPGPRGFNRQPITFPADVQTPQYQFDPTARPPVETPVDTPVDTPVLRVDAPVPVDATAEVADATCRFSLQVFKSVLKKTPGNAILSPLSVQTLLAMLQQGALQGSSRQLEQVLQLKPEVTRAGYAAVIKQFGRNQGELAFSNKIFIHPDFNILPGFTKILRDDFNSASEKLSHAPSVSTQRINEWVKLATKNRITQIVKPGDITAQTKMVLANAIHFKADWLRTFDPAETVVEKFFTRPPPPQLDLRSSNGARKGGTARTTPSRTSGGDSNSIDVQMMYQIGLFSGGKDLELKAKWVEMPYDNEDFSMVVVLPTESHDLDGVVERMTVPQLKNIIKSGKTQDVSMKMPRFKLQSEASFKSILSELGLTDIFNARSHLEGISTKTPLVVSEILHCADIEVKEEGTEAAGASALYGNVLTISPVYEYVQFNMTEPFLAFIIDKKYNIPIFMARVSNPGLETAEI